MLIKGARDKVMCCGVTEQIRGLGEWHNMSSRWEYEPANNKEIDGLPTSLHHYLFYGIWSMRHCFNSRVSMVGADGLLPLWYQGICNPHYDGCRSNGAILMKFSSLVAMKIVILTTCIATSDDNFVNTTTFSLQCRCRSLLLNVMSSFPTFPIGLH